MAMKRCPFPDCGWSHEYDPESYTSTLDADFAAERHYEREHAGRVRVQVVVEFERMLGGLSPREIREDLLEQWEEEHHPVAYVRTEVLEEADDHAPLREGR